MLDLFIDPCILVENINANIEKLGIEELYNEHRDYVKEAFDTNWVVPMGPNVNAFEKD